MPDDEVGAEVHAVGQRAGEEDAGGGPQGVVVLLFVLLFFGGGVWVWGEGRLVGGRWRRGKGGKGKA